MKTVVDCQFSNIAEYISQLPSMMEKGRGDVVYEGRNRVVRFRHEGLSLMVKRFKRVNVVQQVAYTFFRSTKAERAYLFAKEFHKRGIDTPQRVAYMEKRNGLGLFTTGYFVSLETPGTETHLLLREVQDFSHELADAVAAHIVLMHSRGILHGDLNLSNFLCQEPMEPTKEPTPPSVGVSPFQRSEALAPISPSYSEALAPISPSYSEALAPKFSMIDINRSHFRDGWPTDEECLENMVRLTHRRDLYEYLIASYARQRGWPINVTVEKANRLLDHFEHRRVKL